MANTRGMLAWLRKLEHLRGASDKRREMRERVAQAFDAAIADGRMCPVDGPVVMHYVLKWIDGGTTPDGFAGWG